MSQFLDWSVFMFEWFASIQWEYLYDFELAIDSIPFLLEGLRITMIIAFF